MTTERNNNFDLLRILAAGQVVIVHALNHLHINAPASAGYITVFPGVPIFFVISGFLVSESYTRSDLRTYCINRFLRIYPGMWVCLAVSMAIAVIWGGISFAHAGVWIAAQATIVQFYNPDFLRGFGVGVLNGSLWTIPVELQFYMVLPFIFLALRSNKSLIVAIILGAALNCTFIAWGGEAKTFSEKLVGQTLPPHLYMFLIGMFLQCNRTLVSRYLTGRWIIWLLIYAAVEIGMHFTGAYIGGNYINPLSATVLALLVISAAHTKPVGITRDLSYGLYLYHMPVLNAFYQAGVGSPIAAIQVIAISLGLAFLSWTLVERPALRLKRRLNRPGSFNQTRRAQCSPRSR